ncbi:DNA repair protein RecN [Gordonia effusa NBRC 100432]|uniref:DNA repair protein RecN n=1 Tax=Gordonia effusa NBRC 100432 TaxID=1077974 RepID=H0R4U8_9ACTN|nr:DNA repair protein RecN [Gordonia effusa]GAB20099.1 DNA repair protein RecN [Gordonia effusa NBRC 100432]
MLEELSIRGLGVIEEASAEFHPGFTVLTGETGAGKTMVVTSLHLLSGARADPTRVRVGHEKATVEGRFRLVNPLVEGEATTDPELVDLLESAGADVDDDDSVIAVRSVSADGRSRAHVGGRSVPVGLMGRMTSRLLTIHGQNDQLRLLKGSQQRGALDRFAGKNVAKSLRAYQKARAQWLDLSRDLERRRANSRELAQETDRLRFAVDEIAAVDPQPGEDAELVATIRRLTDLDTIRSAAAGAQGTVVGDVNAEGGSVIEGLGHVRTVLESSGDETLRGLLPRVAEALAVVTDIGDELTAFVSDLPTDAGELDQLLNRQAELRSLTRKYAADIDGVIDWYATATARLAEIDNPAESIDELAAAVAAARDDVGAAAVKLHDQRVTAAKSLAKKVSAELLGLAMGGAALVVDVRYDVVGTAAPADSGETVDDPADSPTVPVATTEGPAVAHAGADGADVVEFSLRAHADAVPLPIARSASGGELSRVMLALEVVLAAPEGGSIMVFDEVDAGVGGAAAVEIGRRLARLALKHQVIVVTHLPQVAAFADNHVVIGKNIGGSGKRSPGGHTSTVRTLSRDERIGELARMLAGLGDSDTGRAHAEELLSTAEQYRSVRKEPNAKETTV